MIVFSKMLDFTRCIQKLIKPKQKIADKKRETLSSEIFSPNFSSRRRIDLNGRAMWTIVLALVILTPILIILFGGKNHKLKKQWNVFKLSTSAVLRFVFTMKTEERLEAFRKIHSLYPKFLHIDFLKTRILLIYDPEVAKR